jgi:hypothetical protein
MAGRPKTRAKKIARGECVCPGMDCPQHYIKPEPVMAEDALPQPGTPEWMRHITKARMEQAKTDPAKKGGRPRKPTREEAEAKALDRMLPKAYKVLEEQLDDEDERVRQKAAIDVINRVKGKAPQTIKTVGEQVHTIRYESAAWTWGRELAEAEDVEPLELPPGEGVQL